MRVNSHTVECLDDHAHGEIEETVNMFDINEMIPYVDTILREDDKVIIKFNKRKDAKHLIPD